ncbi:DUF6048 family protein [Flavobacterium sp. MK4S-17]|jgi:hypothetical protein|uniref:DUF6048 family protein n=1 Tax=Flavobacterium sp. MK4S-17 TaxID=2543737 RepID=UPI00135A0502|nr:DUF6048 family protein [Flavobacterium sp. MK4S-17]
MKRTLKYTYSFLLLLAFIPAMAQQQPAQQDSLATAKTERYGIRVGADLHSLARSFYQDGYRGFEIVGDYRLTHKFYAAGELGNVDFTIDDDQVNFTTKGSYFKIGFDYNAYENWLDMENMIYAGVRYGVASFSQNLNSYIIYDDSGYFPENRVTVNREYSSLSAHWVELVGGVKAELFNNLYLGFSVRLNFLITDKKPDNFDNLYLPGFNRTYDGSFGAGFNYTLSYFIPIYKKAKAKTKK